MERLQKVMAHAGVASRRKCEDLITQGVVTVNGKTVTELGYKVSTQDRIEVNGVPISKEAPVYYLFYKPRGVISAVSDDKGRPVVTDYFTDVPERIYPVGRLDYDTSGLLLLTNDGEFSQRLTHPKYELDKVYVAKVKGIADKYNLRPIAYGMKLDGKKTAPARYEILSVDETKGSSVVSLTIHEGRYHQVKRMFEACGLPVQKLCREQYGFLTLQGLRPGQYRALTPKEVKKLMAETKR
ncbi:pseudouridine synthase [Catellicoccus marimammalium]|uniref:Pseudouridine synthase n=1 Tax=Catellicoccus marimammalium M35/04/3 TaxID=1234409 RepID=K8ZC97_9ENTE|nr:pseudouridine synthase [Catellicoccus marimammalium]EKU27652.1 Ribosomal large subunit pseudouridine synthase B [Catellicoccus marimammalium M35/04/3]